jgi:hypothetical protein
MGECSRSHPSRYDSLDRAIADLMINSLLAQQRSNAMHLLLENFSDSLILSPPKALTARSKNPKLHSKNGSEPRLRSDDKSFDAYRPS